MNGHKSSNALPAAFNDWLTVGMSNAINRLHATFGTEVDLQTRDALAPTCPLGCPTVPED